MTARLDVTPKTTEQNALVNPKLKLLIIKKLRLRYCTIDATKLATDIHEASRALFATAELLVISLVHNNAPGNNVYEWFCAIFHNRARSRAYQVM